MTIDSTSDDGKYTISNDQRLFFKPPQYRCAKHGLTEGCVSLWGKDGKLDGEYCLECYKDWVRATLQPVTRAT